MKRLAARAAFVAAVAGLWAVALMLAVVLWGRWEVEHALVTNRFIQARFGMGEWPLQAETAIDPAALDVAEREQWIGPGKSAGRLPLTETQEAERWLARARLFGALPVPLRFTFARLYRVAVFGADEEGRLAARYPDEPESAGAPVEYVLPPPLAALLRHPPDSAVSSPARVPYPAGPDGPPWAIVAHAPAPPDWDALPLVRHASWHLFMPLEPGEDAASLWESEYFTMRPYYFEDNPPPAPHQPRGAMIAINNVGLRDYDIILPKPPGSCRVLCVGASTTYEGMHNLLTYPSLVEYRLNRRLGGRRVDVINGGVSGMNSAKHRVKAADYLFLEPDIAVFYLGANDVMHVVYPTMKVWLDGPRQFLSLRSVKRLLWRWMLPDDAEIGRRIRRAQDDLRAVAEAFLQAGVRVVFCTFAAPDPAALSSEERAYLEHCIEREWGGEQCSYNIYYYLLSRYNEGLRQMAEELGAPCVPVAESMRTGLAIFGDICHMRNAGIERKAEIIADALDPLVRECLERGGEDVTPPSVP